MPNHVKPTKEELEANALKAAEEAEALMNQGDPKPEDKKPDAEKPNTTPAEDKKENNSDESGDENAADDQIDYKKRFAESTREAQILHSKNKKLTEAIEKANQLPEPTEAELAKEFGDEWEDMSTLERRFARDNYLNKKKFELLSGVTSEFSEADKWSEKVGTYIEDPAVLTKHPELEGQEAEFVAFANKPSRRGVDLEDVVSAFLYSAKPVKRHKGSLLESGNGGDKTSPNSGKLTVEEGRKLRVTDYKKFTEYLKAGKIQLEEM